MYRAIDEDGQVIDVLLRAHRDLDSAKACLGQAHERRGVASLARRTWATARTAPGLLAQVAWWRAYYHWVRPHRGLRGAPGVRPCTPAMALGLTDHRWTVAELLAQPLPVPGG